MTDESNREKEEVVEVNASQLAKQNTSATVSPVSNDFQFIETLALQLDNITKVAKVFIKGGLCPIKNESDFVVATVTGMQLGLPMITAINNIFVVNNKPAIATHLMRALVLKAGVTFDKVYDYEPVFVFYEAELKDGKMTAVKIQGKDPNDPTKIIEVPVPRGKAPLKEIDTTKYVAGNKIVDEITKYVFERQLKQPDGTFKNIKVISTFTTSDAQGADLLDKDTYKKYPKRLYDARAFSAGAREIASDVLFGMYSIAEMADANNIKYSMNENFEETIDTTAEIID